MLKRTKVLVICAHAETAMDLEDALRVRSGIPATVFHEGMNILERDRAAAYFADEEFGAQVLICSEIGSEGRNFQFSHHLVLFDLPSHPDLLEQRIGRLDRIGQKHVIELHVPYLETSPQERLFSGTTKRSMPSSTLARPATPCSISSAHACCPCWKLPTTASGKP